MGVSVMTKSRCGFLFALVAIISIGGREVITSIGLLSQNESWVCFGAGVLGFVCWGVGWLRTRPSAEREQSPGTEGEHPLAFLKSLKYWGLILIFAAGFVSCLCSWSRREQPVVVRARPLPRVTVTVTPTNEVPAVSWPDLRLQGVVVNGAKSSAVINGKVLCLGEDLGNVVLVAVTPDHVEVALQGEAKVLPLHQ
jgi:hypothetical protein